MLGPSQRVAGILWCAGTWGFGGEMLNDQPTRGYGISDSFHLDDGGVMFLQNIGPYESHMESHPRRRHSL
jgi:hypothetical protein